MYRVEDKFICSDGDMLLLQSRVQAVLQPDKYSDHGSYKITSLYFDTKDDRHLRDTIEGVSHRKKFRIRIYNGETDLIKLEVKYKAYNRILKKTNTISKSDAEKLIMGQCILDEELASMDSPVTLFNLAIQNELLRPKVVVEYDRSAYIFPPGNVRITFDRNIRCSSEIDYFLVNRCNYAMLRDLNKVLEVKYDEFLSGFIAQILENGNMLQTSFSKYRLCREQIREAER